MTQRRIQDYGSPVVASSLKKMSQAFTHATRLQGFDFVVDAPDRFKITPGSAVTNQGVIILEDESKTLTITNTSSPFDYTVFYDHTDADISGGIAATLTISAGLLNESSVSGVILGYIRYPGSSVPLSASHFIQPPHLKLGIFEATKENSPWLVPINAQNYLITATSGGAITITNTWDILGPKPEMYVKFRNNVLASGTITVTFPFKVMGVPYSLLQMVIATDINATLMPSLIDSDGNIQNLSVSPFTGMTALDYYEVTIPRSLIQTPNTLVYLQFQMTINPSREIKIQALGLNPFNLPI